MIEYFIVSDIHAQYDMLIKALKDAGFDMGNSDHVLLVAGDVLDRGSQGDMLIRFLETLIQQDRLLGVLGNHDRFFIDLIDNKFSLKTVLWNSYNNGFIETLRLGHNDRSFFIEENVIRDISLNLNKKYPIFIKWISNLPLFLEFSNHVIVHGFINFDLDDWHHTDEHYAIWERGYGNSVPESFNKKLIFGHTPNHYINGKNDIIIEGKKIMIDGGAASGIQINILKIDEKTI